MDSRDHLRGSLRALRRDKNTCSINGCFSREIRSFSYMGEKYIATTHVFLLTSLADINWTLSARIVAPSRILPLFIFFPC